jgi:hypothetical protein
MHNFVICQRPDRVLYLASVGGNELGQRASSWRARPLRWSRLPAALASNSELFLDLGNGNG